MRSLLFFVVALASLDCASHLPQPVRVSQHPPWTSKAGPASRPFALRAGTTIRLQPSGANFSIPQDWLEWHEQFGCLGMKIRLANPAQRRSG
jgi:hypothetical protein